MCGRLNLHTSPSQWATALLPGIAIDCLPETPPRYNIAPTQAIPVVRQLAGPLPDDGLFATASVPRPQGTGVRELNFMRWGLIPGWAKDLTIGASMINARSETAHEKPSFRQPLSTRRCLIPIDGYYEWKRIGKSKQPFYIGAEDAATLYLAGLWDANKQVNPGSPALLSCSILTTTARPYLAPIHDRMPVFVPPDFVDTWLSMEPDGRQVLDLLLAVSDPQKLAVFPVSDYVNNARHEGEECIAPREAN